MKVYEILSEMMENNKTIVNKKTKPYDSDWYYKRVKTEDGINLLLSKISDGSWKVTSLVLDAEDLESNDWEIYESNKGEKQ